jgi:hypothetical protein
MLDETRQDIVRREPPPAEVQIELARSCDLPEDQLSSEPDAVARVDEALALRYWDQSSVPTVLGRGDHSPELV